MNIGQVRWLLSRHAPDWLPRIAIAVLGLVGAAWVGVLLPLQEQFEEAQASQRAQRDSMLREADVNTAGDPQERLARFYAFFEGSDGLPGRLERLNAVAQTSGLELRRAEYRMSASPEQKLVRYQIILPVEGSYRAIRRFTAEALEAIPALALTQVKFQRRQISEGRAEAQIIFTLYFKR